jgi:hypothetical protein
MAAASASSIAASAKSDSFLVTHSSGSSPLRSASADDDHRLSLRLGKVNQRHLHVAHFNMPDHA